MVNTHLSAVTTNNLVTSPAPDLSSIYVLTEYKNPAGKPIDGKINIDYIFNYIIDDITDTNTNLHIGREIQFENDVVATGNMLAFNTIYANTADSTIAYDELAALSSLTKADIIALLDDVLGLTSGTTSTSLDLCITTDIMANLSAYIAKAANKIFRNLNQLIRVKRDWRLYGPGATLSGNYLSTGVLQTYTTVPNECFTQYKSGYVAGSTPYGDTTNVGAVVANAQEIISPARVFTVGEHSHAISFNVDRSVTDIDKESDAWGMSYDVNDIISDGPLDDSDTNLFATGLMRAGGVANSSAAWLKAGTNITTPPDAGRRTMLMTRATGSATVGLKTTLTYSGNKKYLETTGDSIDDTHVNLPAYLTYMWKWYVDDTTQL